MSGGIAEAIVKRRLTVAEDDGPSAGRDTGSEHSEADGLCLFFLDLLGVINIIFISPANLGTLYCSTLIYYVELVKIALRYMVDQFDNA